MKKKVFTRPVCVMLSIELYKMLAALTDQREISMSDYIRNAVQEKLETENQNKLNEKGE